MIHKDITGRIIKVGDSVACAYGGTHVLFKGTVVKLNMNTVRVANNNHRDVHRVPECVVVIEEAP